MAFNKRNRHKQEDDTAVETSPAVDTTQTEASVSDENQKNETAAATTGEGAPATASSDTRHKMIKLKDGTQVKRADFIRQRWNEGQSRGAIAKELTELNSVENGGDGKKVPYQVVFAVIKKGTPGGPKKEEAPAAAAA